MTGSICLHVGFDFRVMWRNVTGNIELLILRVRYLDAFFKTIQRKSFS